MNVSDVFENNFWWQPKANATKVNLTETKCYAEDYLSFWIYEIDNTPLHICCSIICMDEFNHNVALCLTKLSITDGITDYSSLLILLIIHCFIFISLQYKSIIPLCMFNPFHSDLVAGNGVLPIGHQAITWCPIEIMFCWELYPQQQTTENFEWKFKPFVSVFWCNAFGNALCNLKCINY